MRETKRMRKMLAGLLTATTLISVIPTPMYGMTESAIPETISENAVSEDSISEDETVAEVSEEVLSEVTVSEESAVEESVELSEAAVSESTVSEGAVGVVSPFNGKDVVMADVYYRFGSNEDYEVPFYFEIKNCDSDKLYNEKFKIQFGDQKMEYVVSNDSLTNAGIYFEALNELIPETQVEDVVYPIKLFWNNVLFYEKNVTFRVFQQEEVIVDKYTVHPYATKVPFHARINENDWGSYEIILTDENGKGIIRKEVENTGEGLSLWELYYQDVFPVSNDDTNPYLGEIKSVEFLGNINLRKPLEMGKNYGLRCNRVLEDDEKEIVFNMSNIYTVQNSGEIKGVRASAITNNCNLLYLDLYGNNLDVDKMSIKVVDISGNEVGEILSTSRTELSEEESNQYNEWFEDISQKISCRVLLTDNVDIKKLFYQVETDDDYYCSLPNSKKLKIAFYEDEEDYYYYHYTSLGDDVWFDQYPNRVGARLYRGIPQDTVIHAELVEDETVGAAFAEGTLSENTVYWNFRTSEEQDYVFRNLHNYKIKYSYMVNGSQKNYERILKWNEETASKWVLDKDSEEYGSLDGKNLPITFYYLDDKYDSEITLTCHVGENRTELPCNWEKTTYYGMPAIKFTTEAPSAELTNGYHNLHLSGTMKGENTSVVNVNTAPFSIHYMNAPRYKVLSYSSEIVGEDHVTTFVMNRTIPKEELPYFKSYISGGYITPATSITAQGNHLIVKNDSYYMNNIMKRYLYLNYSNGQVSFAVTPAYQIEQYDYKEKYYIIYCNEVKGGFLTTQDTVTGYPIAIGSYAYNVDYPLTLVVKKVNMETVLKEVSVSAAGTFSEEMLAEFDENQIYDISLRTREGILLSNQTGFIRAEEVIPPTLRSLTVKSTQEIGSVGSKVDTSQITISSNYSDGSSKSVSVSECTISPETISAKWNNTITVSYQGKSDQIEIMGYEVYHEGDVKPLYDLNGTAINAFYIDETSRTSVVSINGITESLITGIKIDNQMGQFFDVNFNVKTQQLSLILKKGLVENITTTASIVSKGKAVITVAGYEEPLEANLVIPVTYEKPEIKLLKKKVYLSKADYEDDEEEEEEEEEEDGYASGSTYVFIKESNGQYRPANISYLTYSDYEENLGIDESGSRLAFYTESEKKFRSSKKVRFKIEENNWAESIPLSVSVQTSRKIEKPSFTKSTIVLDKSISGVKATTIYYAGNKMEDEDQITLTPLKNYTDAPNIELQSVSYGLEMIIASANNTTKKGTYTYVLQYSEKDRKGIRLKVKVTETNFAKKIPSAKLKGVKKNCNIMSYGELGAAFYYVTPKQAGTFVSNITTTNEQFTVKPLFDKNKRIIAVKIYAKPTAIANLKPNKSYKVPLKITCASIYDNTEILVDSSKPKIDKKRIVNVKVKVK